MTTKLEQEPTVRPSKAVEVVADWWRTCAAAAPHHESMAAARDFNEGWGGVTAEPRGVDYLEVDAGGVPAMWAVPKNCVADRVLFAIHGGGFISGSIYTHRKMFGHFAKAIGCRALIVEYPFAPENQYPTQISSVVAAYHWLLDQGIQPEHIAFIGDSAGGNLVITSMLLARDWGLPLPVAVMPMSPWFDMEVVGASADYNQGKDALLTKEWVKGLAAMYLGEKGDRKDPHVTPWYADLKGLPPIYIQVGSYEVLLDDSTRLADHARKAGVEVRLDIFPAMQHTFQMAAGRAPESDDAIARYAAWIKPKLGLS